MRLACLLVGFALLAAPAFAQSGKRVEFQDREMAAVIPAPYPECWGEMYAVHGFFTRMDGKPCLEKPETGRFISFQWVGDPDSPATDLETYRHGADCNGAPSTWATGAWSRAIDGFRTASCRWNDRNGRIRMSFGAVAVWPSDPAKKVVEHNVLYAVYFATTPEHFDADVEVLKAFMCSIDVMGTGSGSTLCAARVS